jgi:anti-sigma regulatory factor (Ser/Thr protein kinase)
VSAGHRHHQQAPAVPASIPRLRHAVERFAVGLGARDGVLAAVSLAVSEAVSNVVTHAYCDVDTPGPVMVAAWTQHGVLYIAVSDVGRGMKPRPDRRGLGVGLALIAQMADGVEVSDRNDRAGVTVRMRFSLDERDVALPAVVGASMSHGAADRRLGPPPSTRQPHDDNGAERFGRPATRP